MKPEIKNLAYCDGCQHLKELNTLAHHKKCGIFGKVMIANSSMYDLKAMDKVIRPVECIAKYDEKDKKNAG